MTSRALIADIHSEPVANIWHVEDIDTTVFVTRRYYQSLSSKIDEVCGRLYMLELTFLLEIE